MTILTSPPWTMDVYMTNMSASHITSSLPRYSSTDPAGMSWPTTWSLMSSMKSVDSLGRGNRESQDSARTSPMPAQDTIPGTSSLIPPETVPMDISIPRTSSTVLRSRTTASTTPSIPLTASRNPSMNCMPRDLPPGS